MCVDCVSGPDILATETSRTSVFFVVVGWLVGVCTIQQTNLMALFSLVCVFFLRVGCAERSIAEFNRDI